MMIFALTIFAGVSGGGSTDLSWLAPFGAAAPFAGLALIQMTRAQTKLDKLEAEHKADLDAKDKEYRDELHRSQEEVKALRTEMTARERELVLRFGNIIYDSALLYKEGNAAVASIAQSVTRPFPTPAPPAPAPYPTPGQVADLLSKVEELTKKMGRSHDDDDRAAP